MNDDILLLLGASSEIGQELLRRKQSCDPIRVVAHFSRGREHLDDALRTLGDRMTAMQADFSKPSEAERLATEVLRTVGPPTQIVYLPALALRYERFAQIDTEYFERDLKVQVHSAIALLRILLPSMAKSERKGRVVFVSSSVTVGVPANYMAGYTVVKHAQLGLMKSLAVEYARENVNLNAVSPAMVETRFLEQIPAKAIEISAAENPSGRNATPADVVNAIEFLLSEAANYITGVNLPITGGLRF